MITPQRGSLHALIHNSSASFDWTLRKRIALQSAAGQPNQLNTFCFMSDVVYNSPRLLWSLVALPNGQNQSTQYCLKSQLVQIYIFYDFVTVHDAEKYQLIVSESKFL